MGVRVAVVVLCLVTVCAGCESTSTDEARPDGRSTGTTVASPSADEVLERSSVLTIDDLGPEWTVDPISRLTEAELDAAVSENIRDTIDCFGEEFDVATELSDGAGSRLRRIVTDVLSDVDPFSVTSDVVLAASEEEADASLWARYRDPQVIACLFSVETHAAADMLGPFVGVSDVALEEVPVPGLGDASAAYRSTMTITLGSGVTSEEHQASVAVRVERANVVLLFNSTGPIDQAEVERLARLVVDRVAAGL